MQTVTIYTTGSCPYCVLAKRLLAEKSINASEIKIDADPGKLAEMIERTRRRSVPQIFIGDIHVGGYDDFHALARSGELDGLLAGTSTHAAR
ncbi:MAG: glutaredoxin 3 [Pseudomonadota bacterium]|nr:glutaredoxin 3 [Pseudomonadota bacterium]